MLDRTTVELFFPYDREVGKYRKNIDTLQQFSDYVERANGNEDCFVSVYPRSGEIDRVVFDLDGTDSLREAKRLYSWGIQQGFSTIPTISGHKGFHVTILSKPIKVDNTKDVLTDISTYIISQALGIHSWSDVTTIDWHLFGNQSALIRIPNTLRIPERNSYCSYLPPNFVDMSEVDIFRYTKSPHVFDYGMSRKKSFLDLPLGVDTEVIKAESLIEPRNMPHPKEFFHPEDVTTFLSHLLSKRRLLQISQQNPPHNIRIITTLELIDVGLHPKEILNLYSGLHWHDWNERISFNFITDLSQRYYSGSYKLKRPI